MSICRFTLIHAPFFFRTVYAAIIWILVFVFYMAHGYTENTLSTKEEIHRYGYAPWILSTYRPYANVKLMKRQCSITKNEITTIVKTRYCLIQNSPIRLNKFVFIIPV